MMYMMVFGLDWDNSFIQDIYIYPYDLHFANQYTMNHSNPTFQQTTTITQNIKTTTIMQIRISDLIHATNTWCDDKIKSSYS